MNQLILKLNATGDVVRTTALLCRLAGHVTWITAGGNAPLLDGVAPNVRCLAWEDRQLSRDRAYDLVINLEDEPEVSAFVSSVDHRRLFGACLAPDGTVRYTEDAKGWFDLSLISVHGRQRADQLKLRNRRTYQDLIFEGLGLRFEGDRYVLPPPARTGLEGDVALAPAAGPVWPMKNWAYYDALQERLAADGLVVHVLPRRAKLLEHLGDVAGHRCLVSGDSLPMHFALGTGTRCVTIFTCTSPWEIYDYGFQTKIVSPVLDRFFYHRGYDLAATTAIGVDEVYEAVVASLRRAQHTC